MSDPVSVSCDSLMADVAFSANSLANELRQSSVDPERLRKEIDLMQRRLKACEDANKVFGNGAINKRSCRND